MVVHGLLAGLATVATTASAQAPPLNDGIPPVQPLPKVQPLPPAENAPLQGSLDTPSLGGCAPTQLFKATVRNISPGVAAADRAAQPRQLWRQGEKYLRSEESPDPTRGDLPVVVISEPDIWIYNQATRQGRHSVDPGPQLVVKAPILPPIPDLPAPMRALEFGCEAVFVATYAPQQQRVVPWGPSKAALHAVSMGEHAIAVLMDTRRNAPLILSYLRRGQPVLVLRYDEYRHGLQDRAALFQPPKNIKITEAGQEAAPRPLD
jgi:hypothetical protein